jgi:hypothetical protein
MNTDLLDEFCQEQFGHTDWVMSFDDDNNLIIKFFTKAREDYDE